jgi:hypothetical protein
MKEAIRVYALARELSAEPKRILSLCEKSGFQAKNLLSSLSPEQRGVIETLILGNGPGDEMTPALVPAPRPPPTLRAAVRLKPPADR